VESITYWGLSDASAWLGAPAGFVRADGTEKPSYHALHGLIRGDWWVAPASVLTDDAGRLEISGFAGEYRVSCGGATATFSLPKGTLPTGTVPSVGPNDGIAEIDVTLST
jgi:hypothetical protein